MMMVASDIFFWILPIMFGLFALSLWSLSRRDAMLVWARYAGAGFAIAGIAAILDTQRDGAIRDLFVIAVPMHWLVLGLVGHAFILRVGGRTPVAAMIVIGLLGTLFVGWFTLVDPYSAARVATANLVGFALLLLAAVALARAPVPTGADQARHLVYRASQWAVGLTALCYGVRSLIYFVGRQGPEFMASPVWSQYMLLFYFTSAIIGLATGMLLLVSVVLDLVDFHDRAGSIDPLTGIGNRRLLDAIESGHGNGGEPIIAVVMIDLDRFKQVNDRHGHAVGDAVLVAVAELLRERFAATATPVRLGGEEFGLFIARESGSPLVADVERAMAAISELRFGDEDKTFCVTASAGIAMLLANESVSDAMRRADLGLYAAKRAGRNRVVLAPPGSLADTVIERNRSRAA